MKAALMSSRARATSKSKRTSAGPLALGAITLAIAAGFSGDASAALVTQVCGVQIAITDFNTSNADCVVGVHGLITDLNIDVVIEHTWQGDLSIQLERVGGGTIVPLIFRPGDSAQNGGTLGFSANNLGTLLNPFVFDDQASDFYDQVAPFGIGTLNDPGIDDVGGNWKPYGAAGATSLGAYNGQDIFGTWRLAVTDNAGGDSGQILQFSLHAQTRDLPEPGSMALVGLALAGVAATTRRRRAAKDRKGS